MAGTEMCACGRPLHYDDPETQAQVEKLCDELGYTVRCTTPYGVWMVPRHYIALHGIKALELASVAERYGFEKL